MGPKKARSIKKQIQKSEPPKSTIAFRVKTFTSEEWTTYADLAQRISDAERDTPAATASKPEQLAAYYHRRDQLQRDREQYRWLGPAARLMEQHPAIARLSFGAGLLSQLMEVKQCNAPPADRGWCADLQSSEMQKVLGELSEVVCARCPLSKWIAQIDFDDRAKDTVFVSCTARQLHATLTYGGKQSVWESPTTDAK